MCVDDPSVGASMEAAADPSEDTARPDLTSGGTWPLRYKAQLVKRDVLTQ